MQRMSVDIARIHYKSTSGVNRGWRRSRLGGSHGSHFYAWWAPRGAAPVQEGAFEHETDAVFLRDLRHHDDHAPLSAGSLSGDYMPVSVPDLRNAEYAPEPWTTPQLKFARSRATARILKGHPGSGKTTALLHAADATLTENVLYLTFSNELAALAKDYFDRFCSKSRTFTVLTYPAFLRQFTDWQPAVADPAEARGQFRRDLFTHQRSLGGWANNLDALYDELHAHIVGSALPEASGRFPKAERMCLPEKAYQSLRGRHLASEVSGALDAVKRLERANSSPLADRYFPELAVAWRAAQTVLASAKTGSALPKYGCIAVDEVQDLTPIEAFVVMSLARNTKMDGLSCSLLLAGDEAQTVRPTDFEWAWLNDMLHTTVSQPQEFKLPVNLRSPRKIAELVNRAWDYYDVLHKQDRPSGTGFAEIEDDSPDQILYAAVAPAELGKLLTEFSAHEGLAMIAFDNATLPKETQSFVLSPAEAKGLDFHSVCVVNGSALLQRIVGSQRGGNQFDGVHALEKRLAIDQLRVALSRPTERLIWVDAAPNPAELKETGSFLQSAGDGTLHPISVEALRACLDEEELDIEERLQRCQRDALQLVDVKPDLAWSRAQQAVCAAGERHRFDGGPRSSRARRSPHDSGAGMFSARAAEEEPFAGAGTAGPLLDSGKGGAAGAEIKAGKRARGDRQRRGASAGSGTVRGAVELDRSGDARHARGKRRIAFVAAGGNHAARGFLADGPGSQPGRGKQRGGRAGHSASVYRSHRLPGCAGAQGSARAAVRAASDEESPICGCADDSGAIGRRAARVDRAMLRGERTGRARREDLP